MFLFRGAWLLAGALQEIKENQLIQFNQCNFEIDSRLKAVI